MCSATVVAWDRSRAMSMLVLGGSPRLAGNSRIHRLCAPPKGLLGHLVLVFERRSLSLGQLLLRLDRGHLLGLRKQVLIQKE